MMVVFYFRKELLLVCSHVLVTLIQGAARLFTDLNLAPNALRWWEKAGVDIIGKGTFRSFVFPWVSDCHALVEGGTSWV